MKLADGPVPLETDCSGGETPVSEDSHAGAYRRWRHYRATGSDVVMVHRLAAVAWCFDPDEHDRLTDVVRGKEIDHITPIRWLNTEANLRPMDPADHARKTLNHADADADADPAAVGTNR